MVVVVLAEEEQQRQDDGALLVLEEGSQQARVLLLRKLGGVLGRRLLFGFFPGRRRLLPGGVPPGGRYVGPGLHLPGAAGGFLPQFVHVHFLGHGPTPFLEQPGQQPGKHPAVLEQGQQAEHLQNADGFVHLFLPGLPQQGAQCPKEPGGVVLPVGLAE